MISAVGRARRGRSSVVAVSLVAVAVFGAVVIFGVLASRHRGGDADQRRVARLRSELEAYETAIAPAAELAGRAIVAGIRTDLRDFEAGQLAVDVWQSDLEAHIKEFTAARETFARAHPPEIVNDAPAWFDEAFGLYGEAARVFSEAGSVSGVPRQHLLDVGVSIGETADRLFDRAAARIQAARRSLGLRPDPRFSDVSFKDQPA